MREGHVSNDSLSKKSGGAVFRAIEELVGDKELSRTEIFLQRTDGAHRDDALHAQKLHRVDIGAIVDFAGKDTVPAAVACQKGHALPFQSAKDDAIGSFTERRLHTNLTRVRQSAHRIEPTAANDSYCRLGCGFCALRLFGLPCRHLSPLAVKAALLEDFVHRRERILFAVRYLRRKFRKPRLSTCSAQGPFK